MLKYSEVKPCMLATTLNPKLLLTMQNHWIKFNCHKRFNSLVYSTGNIYTDLKKVKLGLSCIILMAKKEEERPQIFTSPFFVTNVHSSVHMDTHPTMLEMYEGSVLDGLPHLSYANIFPPCSSVIGLLLLIFCQRVTSLAWSYCANRQH